MSEPKEYYLNIVDWIGNTGEAWVFKSKKDMFGKEHDNLIHVIEYSAYEDIWKVSKMMEANYLDAKKENAMMREALEKCRKDMEFEGMCTYDLEQTLAKLKEK